MVGKYAIGQLLSLENCGVRSREIGTSAAVGSNLPQ